MKRKRRTYPGSIFEHQGKLYIKFKGIKQSTGLEPTKLGYAQAERLLEQKWLRYNRLEETTAKRITIQEAFDKFIEAKAVLRNKSIETYKYAFNAVISGDYLLSNDTIESDIQNFIKSTNYSKTSKNTYLSHIQWFLNYCYKKKWLPKSEFKSDYEFKNSNKEPEPWSEDCCWCFIEYFKYRYYEVSLLIQFMLETGARMVDALNMKPEDVKPKFIMWYNKKTKAPEPRPYTQRAAEILSELPKREGRIWNWTYRGSSFLNKLMRQAADNMCIERNGRSFQEFRSAYRMKLLNNGVPLEYAMYMLRHKDFKVTDEFYTKYRHENIINLIEKIPDSMAEKNV